MTVGFQCQSVLFCYEISKKFSFAPLFFYKFSKTVVFIPLRDFNESVLLGHEISMTVGFSVSVGLLL